MTSNSTRGRSFSRRGAAVVAAGSAILLMSAVPAMAADDTADVDQGITAGTRTATVEDASMTALAYSFAAQFSTKSLTLSVTDATGEFEGWHVDVESSAFVWDAAGTGSSGGTNIPASDFAISSVGSVTFVAGQAINGTPGNGPEAGATSTGALNAPITVLTAGDDYGDGSYTQALNTRLDIPARSKPGTYTGTLTISNVAGPE